MQICVIGVGANRIEHIMLSDLEIRLVTVEVLQKLNKGVQGLALVVFMRVNAAGNDDIAVKVKPGKFAVMVI